MIGKLKNQKKKKEKSNGLEENGKHSESKQPTTRQEFEKTI